MLWDSLIFSFRAVMPLVLLMALGYYVRSIGVLDKATVQKLSTFCFRYLMAPMLFMNVYALEGLGDLPLDFIAVALAGLAVLVIVSWITAKVIAQRRDQIGVITQMGFRSNYSAVGVTLAISLCGEEGAKTAAALQAPLIIVLNVLAVTFLTAYTDREGAQVNVRGILRGIVKNPLVIGMTFGIACLAVRGLLPKNELGEPVFTLARDLPSLYSAAGMLGRACVGMVLVMLGAQLNDPGERADKKLLAIGCALRLVLSPVIGFAVAFGAQALGLIRLTGPEICVLLSFFAAPSAVNNGIMADQIGGDAALAHRYCLWSTVLSIPTMFLWGSLAHYLWL